MIDILASPAAGTAAQQLSSSPRMAALVNDAVGAYGAWATATDALDACTGTAAEVEAARVVKHNAFNLYNRRVDAITGAADSPLPGNLISVDAGIRYLHASNAAWEHALDNPDDYAGF